jgi:hypothetical protein
MARLLLLTGRADRTAARNGSTARVIPTPQDTICLGIISQNNATSGILASDRQARSAHVAGVHEKLPENPAMKIGGIAMQRIPTALAAALLAASALAHAAAPDSQAVEYFNTATGHYFVTAGAGEALGIDAGAAGPGWVRTGRSFQAWLSSTTAPAGAQPVCRFYSSMANSHFYTASADECQALKAAADRELAATGTVQGWSYEGTAFYIETPKDGQCPAGTTAIDRVYNNGFATGEGSNHRFVDDDALAELMVDRHWVAEGPAFCAEAKPTGTEADLAPTATSFDSLAGTWTGSARWKTEAGSAETSAVHDLSLTIAADGSLTGAGNGCTFTGAAGSGDGFRSFFRGTATAAGCTDGAFNGDYPKVRLERFGANVLMARLQRGDDDTNEVSIDARLTDASAPPPAAGTFGSVTGDWSGTVAWVATQHMSAGNIVERAASNQALALSISDTGAVTGSGFGCTVSGTLAASVTKRGSDDTGDTGDDNSGDHSSGGSGGGGNSGSGNGASDNPGGFGGEVTLAGCTQALFDGTFTRVHVMRAGPSRLVVNLERETSDAQGSTSVEIEGTLKAGAPAPSTGG